ncbi:MAG: DPP IV N-terminal domain-containing protein, partial [Acidobacteria bacterium]|nr:DPP IV N-terminal domain-containing protein [Acidobacteriota bacterium]
MHFPTGLFALRTAPAIRALMTPAQARRNAERVAYLLAGAACLAALLLGASPGARAQGRLEDYQRARRFLPGNLRHEVYLAEVSAHWVDKTDRFWYRKVTPQGSQFILVDAAQNRSSPAFDHEKLAAALSRATDHAYSATALPFDTVQLSADLKSIHFEHENGRWLCTLTNYECRHDTSVRPEESLSPDKRWAAYVKDCNLLIRDVSTGTSFPLTQDGVSGWEYATPIPSLRFLIEHGAEAPPKQPAAVFWSPDSKRLITYRIDSRKSGRFFSLQFVPPDQLRPKAYSVVYPLPGEVLATAEPMIFDLPSSQRIDVKTKPLELPFQDGPEFAWSPDGKWAFYDYDERGYKAKEIRVVQPDTGEEEVLVRESSVPYVDPGETSYRILHETGELVLTSERDGWNHLYLYDRHGQLEKQVTRGPWVVRQIEYIDEKHRRVFFLASGKEAGADPYETYLYRANLDGQDLTLLTSERGNHAVSVSPDGSLLVDTYSRADMPAQSLL